jgi:Zn-dependent M28 family amino/carboxypeptidase
MNDEDHGLTNRLRMHVEQLAGDIGERNVFVPAALQRAGSYISAEWARAGYIVESHAYDVSGIRCANLITTRRGRSRETEAILVGAHYDSSIGCPGANDNASGVAALLEISRLFQTVEPELTVRFVAFVNEEPPFFASSQQGSMVYARAVRRREDNIRLMVALDTIGYYSDQPQSQRYPPLFRFLYPDRGNFVGIISDLRSRKGMRRLANAFREKSKFPLETTSTFRFVPGVSWSDHRSFWHEGYRAVMVTDTAFYRYRHYHRPTDTPDKLSYRAFAEVTRALFDALAVLSRDGID